MAVLPQNNNITDTITVIKSPGLTWYIDKISHRIVNTVDGFDAVKQAVEIILLTERYKWVIYSPYAGMEYAGLLGNDPAYIKAELKRRLIDALTVDDRITGISDYTFTVNNDTATVGVTVNTVYGDYQTQMEVAII